MVEKEEEKSWAGMKIARHNAMALFVVDFDILMFCLRVAGR